MNPANTGLFTVTVIEPALNYSEVNEHLKSPATQLFIQYLLQNNNKKDIYTLHFWTFVRGSTSDWWIPLTKWQWQYNVENICMSCHCHDLPVKCVCFSWLYEDFDARGKHLRHGQLITSTQYSVGYSYLPMHEIPASGTNILIWGLALNSIGPVDAIIFQWYFNILTKDFNVCFWPFITKIMKTFCQQRIKMELESMQR